MKRAALDYGPLSHMRVHAGWEAFERDRGPGRLVLMTTRAAVPLQRFCFEPDDTLLMGRESAGVPDFVHHAADARLVIPMMEGARSMNLATSAAVATFEALRQIDRLPAPAVPAT